MFLSPRLVSTRNRPAAHPPLRVRGSTRYPELQAEGESLPWVEKLEVLVTTEPLPGIADAARLRGDYRLELSSLLKFLRCSRGVQWRALPVSVADATRGGPAATPPLGSRLSRSFAGLPSPNRIQA